MIDEILERMESLRIDVDANTEYCDPTGELRSRYERANEMLDDCMNIVRRVGEETKEQASETIHKGKHYGKKCDEWQCPWIDWEGTTCVSHEECRRRK